MLLLFTSFMAGVLTVLAPCVLPLLPIIIGGSAGSKSNRDPILLVGSLTVSIILFTLLLRASTLLIGVPTSFWSYVSGGILVFFGIITLFPTLWGKVSGSANNSSKKLLHASAKKSGWQKPVMMGAALGPVFTSCSPTYSLILATVLPASFLSGVFYVTIYALGLASVLILIAIFGHKVTKNLRSAADPKGTFKKILGLIFLLVGMAIIFKWDKAIEAQIIQQGYFGITSFEEQLVDNLK
jgi:cytochrome c-type biogenesis protein